MTQIKIENVQKNFDYILEKVGTQSFINWDKFSYSSSQVINSIEQLNKKITQDLHSKKYNFIDQVKKLKSLDLPDLIAAVKNKRLPKQALRGVLPRFKAGQNGKIQLIDSLQSLKQSANKQFEEYLTKNNVFLEELRKYTNFIEQKIKQSGYEPQPLPENQIKATVKFSLSEQLATKLASQVKIQLIPGTKYIGLKTYSQIVGGSFQLVREENNKLTRDARVKQRESVKDSTKYLGVMNQYLLNSEALIIEGQKLLAKKVGLDSNQLEQSQIVMINGGFANHLLVLQSQLRTKVKQSIPPTQQVSYQLAKQIIEYQTKLLDEKKEQIKKVFDGLEKSQQNIQIIPMILALILNDMVFEKYGYEEQDFMKNINEEIISQNPQLSKIFVDMEVAIIKLMQYIGVVNAQVGKLLQQGATQRGQAPQQAPQLSQVGQQSTMPGIMPNVNPLQMLQRQQIQQLLAAQKKQSN